MMYIVKVVQTTEKYEDEVKFLFRNLEEACRFMEYSIGYGLACNPKTSCELSSYDEAKARQEELLDGITEDMEKAFKEALKEAEEEEDRESETEVW